MFKRTLMIAVAVIGCGRWGQNLVRVFNELPGARVTICCNRRSDQRLNEIKTRYPHVRITQNLPEVLNFETAYAGSPPPSNGVWRLWETR